ncbi:glucose dehydrogenase [FAD, quinone]-like [Aethina tumida]|uniref:glucose dehydrogenase [FAD, quinone]-like n=1 Tax=Aethina tumida TaxID=116153 RepID=UPI00214891CA|nr:glucose dehydrogenase [FAD, quinone]-like [Aethina tumida]
MKMKPYLILTFIVYLKYIHCVSEKDVNELNDFLQDEMKKIQNRDFRTDNSEFEPTATDPPDDFGEFDFIIVGAGSTGTILANRLSEISEWKILLLEAGDFPDNITHVPFMIDMSRFTRFNWGYKSTPQTKSCLGMVNRQCIIPRGKGVGGTSLVNGLIYVRGHPSDFDKWAAMGNPGWSYKDVLPIFKITEGIDKNNPMAVIDWKYHNASGPWHTEFYPFSDPCINAYYEANEYLGYKRADVNSPQQIGFSPKCVNIKNGARFDTGTAFILPIVGRPNLSILTRAYAIKINFKNVWGKPVANSVTFSYTGRLHTARARHEIIVSSGSINTPQLLMLSGVGPKKHLKEMNIPVVKDLPVGKVIREHPTFYGLLFSSNYTEPIKPFKEYVREFLNAEGPLTIPGGIRAFGFYKTKYEPEPTTPDLEMYLVYGNCTGDFAKKAFAWNQETFDATFAKVKPAQCFSLLPETLNARSQGSVKLKTNSPYDFPLIDLAMLTDKENIDASILYEGVKLALKLVDTDAFKKIDAKLAITPLPACKQYTFLSKEYWYCAIEQMTVFIFHPVGTCPMGPNASKFVVDNELKVHGIKQLRVADASVFPFTLSGHPSPVCVMIGEKLAMMLKEKYL